MKRKKCLIIFIFGLSGLLGFTLSYYLHANKITSVSNIEVIQTFHYPARFVKQMEGDPEAGKKIFKEFCSACHAKEPPIDIHAPRIGDKKTWKIRRQLGLPALLAITINGAGAMPARGGCFECSDEQLQEAIQYILDESN